MASRQKSTIVRFRNRLLRAWFRYAEYVAPRRAGRAACDLWFTAPPRMADQVLPGGGAPFEVEAQGHPVRGLVWGDDRGGRPHRLPGARLGRSRRAVRRDGDTARGGRPPRGHVRRTGPRRLRPRTGRPGADQRGGVRQGPGRRLLPLRAGRGRRRALDGHHLDLPRDAVRLARRRAPGVHRAHGRVGVAVRPVPAGARLRSSRPGRVRQGRGRVRRRAACASSTPASRPGTSRRCPRW